jgi:signal transduction histidine kinase
VTLSLSLLLPGVDAKLRAQAQEMIQGNRPKPSGLLTLRPATSGHADAEPDTVRGDDAQLQQVFMNLLLNALEAMGTNGVLTVKTETVQDERSARQLRINIQDTGVGVAPENLEHLFEPFFTTKKNGAGLGLAISQRIALEHHGMIHVQSDPGKGSRFSLSLPAFTAA